ncbi:Cytochrome c oxidase subunit 3, partial [Trachymyrmex cornetzi]
HHSIINSNINERKKSLFLTIISGIYFSTLQLFEYLNAPFTIADSIYGSTFFIATGFHGIHVVIGTLFLLVCLMRLYKIHFSPHHHFGFEAAT